MSRIAAVSSSTDSKSISCRSRRSASYAAYSRPISSTPAAGARPAAVAANTYESGCTWQTFAHSISVTASASAAPATESPRSRAASRSSGSFDSTSCGGRPPITRGQK